MKNYFTVFLFLWIYVGGCSKEKIQINPQVLNKIQEEYHTTLPDEFLVFYFDGSCAYCIGKLYEVKKSISGSPDKLELFLIATTTDSIALKFNIYDGKITEPLIILPNDSLMGTIPINSLLTVNQEGRINNQKQM